MVVAVAVGLAHVDEEAGQVICIGRGSDLVVHDAHGVVGLADVQHCLNKVLAVDTEYPGDAHDEVFLQKAADGEFSLQLGLAVDVERRVVLVVGLPGALPLSVEDVVRADVDHLGVCRARCLGDVPRSVCVDGVDLGLILLIFCCVYGCPGRAVDDEVGVDLFYCSKDCVTVCDIELNVGRLARCAGLVLRGGSGNILSLYVGADRLVAALYKFIHAVVTQLAVNACYKYSHSCLPCLIRGFP